MSQEQQAKRTTNTIVIRDLYPDGIGGRYRSDGPSSGEELRDDHIIPALEGDCLVCVDLVGIWGFPPSTLEEVFGGLVRKLGPKVRDRILVTTDAAGVRWAHDAYVFMQQQIERQS